MTDHCWVMTEGAVGMEIQAVALARALGFEPRVFRLAPRWPWRRLPPGFWPDPLGALGAEGDRPAPPWPELVITCGRNAVAPAASIRRRSGASTMAVHIQDPKIATDRFDAIVVPRHDRLRADNVIVTRGSLHAITPQTLADAAARFQAAVADLPRPLLTVLIGGPNRAYPMTPDHVTAIGQLLRDAALAQGLGLAISLSRRTGEANAAALRTALGEDVPARIWAGDGENPYLGFLALGDAIAVTPDSVNMTCEAAATGKPVHVLPLPGGSGKFRRFHEGLQAEGVTRPFRGRLEHWTYPPLDDTREVADTLRRWFALPAG